MDAGGTDETAAEPVDSKPGALPDPDPNLVAVSAAPPSDGRWSESTTTAPVLPRSEARPPVPMAGHVPTSAGSSTWYRTDQQRYKSVYRRANPWYRRVARGVVGLSVIAVVAAGLYYGAQAVQDYMQRDKLPAPGQQAAPFASTSFLVTSSAPAPELNGTVTIDNETGAFEFVGGLSGPQAGVEIVSPDGTQMYVRRLGGDWHAASTEDPDVGALARAVPYLLSVDDADDVLENQLRKRYVDLDDQTTEGVEPDSRERYEMTLDTSGYSANHPLQWRTFKDSVVPGIAESDASPLTMWIDEENVVVRLRDDETHWAWERLTYSDQRFTPIDPSGVVVSVTPPATTTPAG